MKQSAKILGGAYVLGIWIYGLWYVWEHWEGSIQIGTLAWYGFMRACNSGDSHLFYFGNSGDSHLFYLVDLLSRMSRRAGASLPPRFAFKANDPVFGAHRAPGLGKFPKPVQLPFRRAPVQQGCSMAPPGAQW